ncbi:MAG: proton-conducting transporter membrane subunit, partial [Actinomycetales bacterium]
TTETPDGRFSALMCLFLGAMSLAVLADNLGVLWVAIEATTITTAFLVAHGGGRHGLEAAWKYVVLGSVGVAIAFLGIVLLYAATGEAATLSWHALRTGTDLADSARIALALAVLGLATKAGLAPMHSWLPDAHSQAPAQVSGLMSGVLLSVAFVGILRLKAISDAALGVDLMRTLLLIAALLSLAVAAALVLTQRNYKRLLAYSSIEHMGILALGAAIGGPLATAAVLLHILGHGLAKAGLFVVAGRILRATASHEIQDVHSLLERAPSLARPWLAGTTALLGFPPFTLFLTEVAIIVAGYQRGLVYPTTIALVLLLIVFAGISRHVLAMTLTRHDAAEPSRTLVPATAPSPATHRAGPQPGAGHPSPEPAALPGGGAQPPGAGGPPAGGGQPPVPTYGPDPATPAQRAVVLAGLAVVALLPLLAGPLTTTLTAAAAVLGVTP